LFTNKNTLSYDICLYSKCVHILAGTNAVDMVCETTVDSQPFRSRATLPGANRPTGPWPIRSLELSLPGTFALKSIRSQEHSLSGTFVPCLSVTLFVTFRYILMTCICDVLMFSSCDFVILVFVFMVRFPYMGPAIFPIFSSWQHAQTIQQHHPTAV